MALDTKQAVQTLPYIGCYSITSAAAVLAQYPTDGRGNLDPSAGLAHWTALGLAAGEFEVEILHVIQASGGNTVITELKAVGKAHIFPGGALAGSTNVNGGGGNAGNFAFTPGAGLRCRDGFTVSFLGTGGTILYRIHSLQN